MGDTITNPTITILGRNGGAAVAIVEGMTIAKGSTGKIRADLLGPGKLIVHLKPDGQPVTQLGWDTAGPTWEIDFAAITAPAGKATLTLEHRNGDSQVWAESYRVKIADATPTPSPTVPPSSLPDLRPWGGQIGAVTDAFSIPKIAAKMIGWGIPSLRTFSTSCPASGEYYPANEKPIGDALAANPSLIVYGMHSVPQSAPFWPTTGAIEKFFARLKPFVTKWGKRYRVTGPNEWNLLAYLKAGQQNNVLSMDVVKKLMTWMGIARDVLGKDAYIVGPSIGYDALPQLHIDYLKAMIQLGLLDLVDEIDDHLYPTSLANCAKQLGGVRNQIGDKPLSLTEVNLKYLPVAQWRTQGRAYITEIQAVKAKPFIYRAHKGDDGVRWSDAGSVMAADGSLNPITAYTWGLA